MSTDVIALRALPLVLLVAAAAMAATSALAAEVVFRPALTFGLFHDGNVHVVDFDPHTMMRTSSLGDDVAALGVDLAVDRNTADSKMSFSYQPSSSKYHRATGSDYVENAVFFSYSHDTSARTRTEVSLDAIRTEFQGIRSFNADRPTTLVPRTTVTRVHTAVAGTVAASRRSMIDWGIGGGLNRYDSVAGVMFQNDRFTFARGAWRYALSERSTIGPGFDVGWVGYDSVAGGGNASVTPIPNAVTETLSLVGTHSAGRYVTVDYAAGITRTVQEGDASTDGTFRVVVRRVIEAESELRAGVGRGVSPGSGLGGISLDTGGWITYSRTPSRRGLSGSLNGGYWYREDVRGVTSPPPTAMSPTTTAGTNTKTLDLSGSVGWNFNRFLALNAACSYVDQTTSYAAQTTEPSAPSALGTRYVTYGLYIRWALRGR